MKKNNKEKQKLYTQLLAEKEELKVQINDLNADLDGSDNPDVAKIIQNLEFERVKVEKRIEKTEDEIEEIETKLAGFEAELNGIVSKISNISQGQKIKLLEAIQNKRWFFFKEPREIIFDTHTGYMWANLNYDPNELVDNGWRKPNQDEAIKMIDDKTFPFQEGGDHMIKSNAIIQLCTNNGMWLDEDYPGIADEADFFLPCNSTLATGNQQQLTQEERADESLNIFISQNWTPIFDSKELNVLYEKLFKTRPELIKKYGELEAKIEEMSNNTRTEAMIDGFNFEKEIAEFDLSKVDRTLISYNEAVIKWLSNILEKIDLFKEDQEELLTTAENLNNKVAELAGNYDNNVLNSRNEFLKNSLDFNIESVESEMLDIKEQANNLKKELETTTKLDKLAEIEKRSYPSFTLIAEQTAKILNNRLEKIDWFRDNREIVEKIIELHDEWCNDYYLLHSVNRNEFFKKGKEEVIEDDLLKSWFEAWVKERDQLEERLLPLMQAGFEEVIDFDILNSVMIKVTEYREKLKNFYLKKRLPIYIKYGENENGELLDSISCEKELFEISEQFHKAIEELIFTPKTAESRLFIAKWAQKWFDVRLGEIIAISGHNSMAENIAKLTLKETRKLKNINFTALIRDKSNYAKQREESYEKMNSLTRKMIKTVEKTG